LKPFYERAHKACEIGPYNKTALYTIQQRYGFPIMGKISLSEEEMRKKKLANCAIALHYKPLIRKKKIASLLSDLFRLNLDNYSVKKIPLKLFKNVDFIYSAIQKRIFQPERIEENSRDRKFDGYLLNIMSEQIPDPESRVMLGQVNISVHIDPPISL